MSQVRLVSSRRFGDHRGWFSETYNAGRFLEIGIACQFVQDNHSLSKPIGTVRGLHFQTPPYGQDKLVRCIRGAIFDVAVDIRHGSPTFGKWVGAELSAENGLQLYVPIGFAHGFMTLQPDTEVTYKVSSLYAPAHDGGIRWDDPEINIKWPLPKGAQPVLSSKDLQLPSLREFKSTFAYDGKPLEPLST